MSQDSNIEQIEARLNTIEENLKEVRTALQALLHTEMQREGASSGEAAGSAAQNGDAWLRGKLQSLAAQAPAGGAAEPEVVGLMDSHDSITWCYSRFVCITMQCGGSGWC